MKYLVVGWSSKYVDPGFRTEHETLEAALAEAHAELADNSHQVSIEVFASTRLLLGGKLASEPNGVLATPERFEEAKAELGIGKVRLPKANAVAELRTKFRERRAKGRPLDKSE